MPVGGKLTLKGGEPLLEKKIKKKKKKPTAEVPEEEAAGEPSDPAKPKQADAQGISVQSGRTYEDEFEFEKQRRREATQQENPLGRIKSTPWGTSYRAAPEILHGYKAKVTGKTAEERLDMRAAQKSDKFAR
mmetsp:Transcript_17857/g.53546  ORF Transcript_17857/g.53546 Transcript_17857/m.53546 type:complete len:132 (-) Transcript_17857:130-525(-)